MGGHFTTSLSVMLAMAMSAHGAATVYDSVTTAQLRADGVTGEVEINNLLDNRNDVLEFPQSITKIILQGDARLLGGRISTLSPPIAFSGATFDDVILDRDLRLEETSSDYLFAENAFTVNSILTICNYGDLIAKNTQTFGGSGLIQVGSEFSPHPPSAGIWQEPNSTLTIGSDLTISTIHLGGFLGTFNEGGWVGDVEPDDHVSLINHGTVRVKSNTELAILGRNWKNFGTLHVESNARLHLAGVFSLDDIGPVEGPGQVFYAGWIDLGDSTFNLNTSPTGPLQLGGAWITGGRLIAPGRVVEVHDTYATNKESELVLSNTTLALDLDLTHGPGLISRTALRLENSTIRLRDYNSHVRTPSFEGSGLILFDAPAIGSPGPNIETRYIGPDIIVRTVASQGTISAGYTENPGRNYGQVISDAKPIIVERLIHNHSRMTAIHGGLLSFHGTLVNQPDGVISATDNSTLQFWTETSRIPFVNDGLIVIDETSTFELTTSTITGVGLFDVAGQMTMRSNGFAFGQPTISCPLLLRPSAELIIDIGMIPPATANDKLLTSGPLTLDGTLHVMLNPARHLLPGEALQVLTYADRQGVFQQITSNNAAYQFIPDYTVDSLWLNVAATFEGDANLDADVDLQDLGVLATHYGIQSNASWSMGDFDLDGDVDLNDLGTLATNYGVGQAQAFADFQTLTAVPEPHLSVAVFGLAFLCRRRRLIHH